jgi:lipopolysaccharide/colanic/teichoic acid biosynthesis glycosyltransferase
MKNTPKLMLSPLRRSHYFYNPIKRLMDIFFSLGALIILLPLLLLIAILIACYDGFPVFFRQQRTGFLNRPFTIYKFRTMANEQPTKREYQWSNGVPDEFVFKSSVEKGQDTTRVGHFLRTWSLDELPQFFNVLFGSMSLVGPRPEIPDITCHYNDTQLQRLSVKPGITGLAQVNGRSHMNHSEKIKFDTTYCMEYGFIMDLRIILLTFIRVFSKSGAV